MAIYSCNISNVSRAAGSSSCATLSYISAQKIYCDRTGETFNYGRQERVITTETLLPKNAPEEYKDPSVLFNAIENYETAKNARPAKKIMVALPREFNLEEQREVMKEFCSNLTKQGYACVFSIHEDKDGNNPHAHVLVANRPINSKGEFDVKRIKEYVLDENGERVPVIDKETGLQKVDSRNRKQWKRRDVYTNPLDQKQTLKNLRSYWADICNAHLEPAHHITDKSHEERGLDTLPTIHEGYKAREIERHGQISDKCEYNRGVLRFNAVVEEQKANLKQAISRIADYELIKKALQLVQQGHIPARKLRTSAQSPLISMLAQKEEIKRFHEEFPAFSPYLRSNEEPKPVKTQSAPSIADVEKNVPTKQPISEPVTPPPPPKKQQEEPRRNPRLSDRVRQARKASEVQEYQRQRVPNYRTEER